MIKIIIFSLITVSLYATQINGLTYLNDLRASVGLIPFKKNSALDKAARAHAKYLMVKQRTGHYEKKSKYSTGKTPSDRVIKAGYPSTMVMENISINTINEQKSIDNLFSAIYHRLVFLNLDKDEIGFGSIKSQRKRAIKQVDVYDLGSSTISKLCSKFYILMNGEYYLKNVCQKSKKMIPQKLIKKKKREIQKQNSSIVLYPYDGQNNVYPAFYNETPDPLPNYKVSGFPISIQFNPAFYKSIKLKTFKLYTEEGKEIIKTKLLDVKKDRHHILSKFEFALMPLARLEYAQRYRVEFEAIVDGKNVKKRWSFNTQESKEKLYRVSKNSETLHVKAGETILLYMVPSHRKDLLKNYRAKGGIKAEFVDQNTLRVTLPKRISIDSVSMKFSNKKRVSFIVE